MKKIGLIGGGHHSRHNHLPALERYRAEHPEAIQLTAFCDLNPEVVESVTAKYGFEHGFTSVDEMISSQPLDGVIAVTPLSITKMIAAKLIEAGLPMVIEKPPGKDVAEAEEICQLVEANQAPVMVSVNRRFDPALVAAKQWMGARKLEFIRGTMLRNSRREEDFFSETGLHALDAMRWFAGDIADFDVEARRVDGVVWRRVSLTFASGASGLLEVLPTCGMRDETYDLFGADFRVHATNGEMSTGEVAAWENGEKVLDDEPAKGQPGFIRNGTLDETAEFIMSLVEGRSPRPSPRDVIQSLELCHQMQAAPVA